jgi:hypothetical protein
MSTQFFRIYDGPYDISYPKELGWLEATNYYDAIAKARTRWPGTDPHCSEYGYKIEDCKFENHQVWWPIYAEKYKDAKGDLGRVARMLQYSLDLNDEILRRYRKTSQRHNALFWAFMQTVDRLPIWARWAVVTPKLDSGILPLGAAWKSIQRLNEWRRTNRYNIREWDDA